MSITSSREREENKKYAAPPPGRDYPPTATGSAWVDYSILCRIWQERAGPLRPLRGHLPRGGRQGSLGFSGLVLAPPVGELAAELTERAGYGLPRRCAPRNDGTGD